MTEPQVNVISRPRTPQLTDVPPPLKQWAATGGMRLSWQANDPNVLSLKVGQRMYPVRASELQESEPELWQEIEEHFPITVNDNGHFQRADAVLCVQAQEDWQYWDDIETADRIRREHGAEAMDNLEEEVQDLLAGTGHHSGAPALVGRVPTAREAVRVAKQPSRATGVEVGIEQE